MGFLIPKASQDGHPFSPTENQYVFYHITFNTRFHLDSVLTMLVEKGTKVDQSMWSEVCGFRKANLLNLDNIDL